jgi:hypothetical protein
MLSGFAVFRWCELSVGMNLLRFLHPLLLLIDLGWVSSPDISVRFLVDNHLVGSAPTMSCWLLVAVATLFVCSLGENLVLYGDLLWRISMHVVESCLACCSGAALCSLVCWPPSLVWYGLHRCWYSAGLQPCVYWLGLLIILVAGCGALLGARLGEVVSPCPKHMPLVSLVLLQVWFG